MHLVSQCSFRQSCSLITPGTLGFKTSRQKPLSTVTDRVYTEGTKLNPCRIKSAFLQYKVSVCVLTVDLDSDGADGGHPVSVLSLAVVASPLVAADVFYPQSFVVQIQVV